MSTNVIPMRTTGAEEINEAHRLARRHAESAVEHAIRCGNLLMREKAKLRHGEFESWVGANCEFPCRTARAYMQAARESQNGNALPFSTLREALGYDDRKPEPPQQQQIEESPVPHARPLTHAPADMAHEECEHIAKPPKRHPVHRGMRYRIADQEIERGITALTGLAIGLGRIEINALDLERINEWDAEIGRQIAIINRFRRNLRDNAGGRL